MSESPEWAEIMYSIIHHSKCSARARADTFSIVYSPCSCWIGKSVWAVLSHVQLFATPSALAHQAPLPMEFSRQEYWSGCYFLLQRHFTTEGLNLHLLSVKFSSVVESCLPLGGFFTTSITWEAQWITDKTIPLVTWQRKD